MDVLTKIPRGALTLPEAAARLDLCLRAVQRLAKAGHLSVIGYYRHPSQHGAAGQLVTEDSVCAYRAAPLRPGRPRKVAQNHNKKES